jgi:3-dehydrosphinganine reductase
MIGRSTDFHNKLVLITGGSNGIGLALANLFVDKGAHGWLLARREHNLEKALRNLNQSSNLPDQRHGYVTCDVSDNFEVESAIEEVIQTEGIPDILINCAGVVHPGEFLDLDMDKFHWMMDINFFGLVNTTRKILPGMINRGSGHIVNISSMAAVLGIYGYSAYGPSKSAVVSFSEALRMELKPKGILVTIALPTDTDTDQLRYEDNYRPPETKAIAALGSVHTPEGVAEEIIKGISRKKFLILPGFDAKLLYWAEKILGNSLFPIFDLLIRWTQSRKPDVRVKSG